MNSTEIFNYLFEEFNKKKVEYVIIHSYQNLPKRFDSDIDIAIDVKKIEDAIKLLDHTLKGTGWCVIQFWRHEYYAADCVISNDKEFLQVDFCSHYERNGRMVMTVSELLKDRKKYKNFYIPASVTEFTYILVKKILKKNFSESSKEHLTSLWLNMNEEEKSATKKSLKRFLSKKRIDDIIKKIEIAEYDSINLDSAHIELRNKTSELKTNIHYKFFDTARKIERIIHPTGLFIVLLGVDGAGKTTIAEQLKTRYVTAFRRINHYHSRVRVLKDISQIKNDSTPVDVSNPHGKKHRSGKVVSTAKFGYYFLDFLIGNWIITKAKIKSSLVLVERYYYDYTIDKVRYNLNLSDSFLNFFGRFVKKPDAIFILTGDSKTLQQRKNEITLEEIDEQKLRLQNAFSKNPKAVFIDTTEMDVDECVNQMLKHCNKIMRERRKWK
jgi:thymidylate kinase